MTLKEKAKEKAKDLVSKFYWSESEHSTSIIDAKKFATIAVDEILSLHKKIPLETLELYAEVKNEISNF